MNIDDQLTIWEIQESCPRFWYPYMTVAGSVKKLFLVVSEKKKSTEAKYRTTYPFTGSGDGGGGGGGRGRTANGGAYPLPSGATTERRKREGSSSTSTNFVPVGGWEENREWQHLLGVGENIAVIMLSGVGWQEGRVFSPSCHHHPPINHTAYNWAMWVNRRHIFNTF